MLRIGELAAQASISIDTIRYYERRRLLPHAARSNGGFRLFKQDMVERIRFIRQAQSLGFSLDEIRDLLSAGNATSCRHVRDLLSKKLTELDERMRTMKSFRRVLLNHLKACERELSLRGDAAQCPVLEELTLSHKTHGGAEG